LRGEHGPETSEVFKGGKKDQDFGGKSRGLRRKIVRGRGGFRKPSTENREKKRKMVAPKSGKRETWRKVIKMKGRLLNPKAHLQDQKEGRGDTNLGKKKVKFGCVQSKKGARIALLKKKFQNKKGRRRGDESGRVSENASEQRKGKKKSEKRRKKKGQWSGVA